VQVGDGEMQRRAFGEKYFNLMIQQLKRRMKSVTINAEDIQKRVEALNRFIPSNDCETEIICANIANKLLIENELFAKK
jgi:hypothetical protein